MSIRRWIGQVEPRYPGAILGMVLAIVLYVADAALKAGGGSGLGAFWLLLFLLPGVLAAWIAHRRGLLRDAEKEGALAGLLTALFASLVILVALVEGVLNIDWTQYAAQAGAEIASAVKASIVPAALVAGLATMLVIYTGCVLASWLGAALYSWYAGIVGAKGQKE